LDNFDKFSYKEVILENLEKINDFKQRSVQLVKENHRFNNEQLLLKRKEEFENFIKF
jgi:hypothetical protein